MTLPKLTTLTDEQINVLIAEACGWIVDDELEDGAIMGRFKRAPDASEVWDMIPDYCRSLDAMHEAEKALGSDGMASYGGNLRNICVAENIFQPSWHATAKQRACAFLIAVGRAVQ